MRGVGTLGWVIPTRSVPGAQVAELLGIEHVAPPPAPPVPQLAAGDPKRAALEWQEADLLSRHQQHWMAEIVPCCVSWPGFQRGFIEAVDCSAVVFIERADDLFSQAPVRDLTLYDVVPYLGELARCPGLCRLSTLRLTTNDTEPLSGVLPLRGFADLCVSPHLRHLRVLDLTGCGIGLTGVGLLTLRTVVRRRSR